MSSGAFIRALSSGDTSEAWYVVFDQLMSVEKPDLQESIDLIEEEEGWPDEFRYGLEGLQAYRDYYDDRMDRLSPEQAQQVERYDEEWAMELLDQMHRQRFGSPQGVSPEYEPE